VTHYLGIDQTGAIDLQGKPRPLPACLLEQERIHFFDLPAFQRSALAPFFSSIGTKKKAPPLLIGLDCVLGLAEEVGVGWREALRSTLKLPGYGRKPAKQYFKTLAHETKPRRKVEILCQAQSVFSEYPFQKNIQTGTFRFWKEMAQDENWFFAPLVEGESKREPGQIPIFEGYPSLGWKLLFGSKTRQPEALGEFLLAYDPALNWSLKEQVRVEKNPNLADALVLALATREFADQELRTQTPNAEGWILGASVQRLVQAETST
jgi:hypothetical protein